MNENTSEKKLVNLTILLTAGRLPTSLLHKVNELAEQYHFNLYLSTLQNLRLVNVREEDAAGIRSALAAVGAQFKAPGMFPSPKVCVGKPFCNLALVDTGEVAEAIWARFGGRQKVKPKLKIVIAACPASCSNALLADIGIVATRHGYNLYLGGKGGTIPKVGLLRRKGASLEEIIAAMETIVDFHDRKTPQKQRLFKLLDDPEFPLQSAETAA